MAIFGKNKSDESKDKKDQVVKKVTTKKTATKDLYSDEKKELSVEKKSVEAKTKKFGNAYRILVKPLITEKASTLQAENKYIFEVSLGSNKIEIAEAIEEVYSIKPVAVNTVRVIGKKVRSGKSKGKRRDWKKAVVTLPAGKTIKVYEGV